MGSSLHDEFKRICLDDSASVVPVDDKNETLLVASHGEELDDLEENVQRRFSEDFEFRRLSLSLNLFGFEVDGKEPSSTSDFSACVAKHTAQ